jgi:hypothetical protein
MSVQHRCCCAYKVARQAGFRQLRQFRIGTIAVTEGSVCAGPPPSLDRTASEAEGAVPQRTRRLNPRDHHGMIFLVIIDLAIWYLARPEPLLVQREVEGTSIDIAARVSGPPAEDSGKTRRGRSRGALTLA